MEIKYNMLDNVLYANLKGELDEYTAEYVRVSLDSLLKDISCLNRPELVLDFSGVSFMDSTGIGMLLGRYKKIKAKGMGVFIENPSTTVEKIMQISGLYKIMPKI